jgi:hypothetical protein
VLRTWSLVAVAAGEETCAIWALKKAYARKSWKTSEFPAPTAATTLRNSAFSLKKEVWRAATFQLSLGY